MKIEKKSKINKIINGIIIPQINILKNNKIF